MRAALRLGVSLLALPLATAFASASVAASDSTACRARSSGASESLGQSLGLSSIRYERSTFMTLPTNPGTQYSGGNGGEINQQRFMVALCKAPEISFGLAMGNGQNMNFVTGEPPAVAQADPHYAVLNMFGAEAQWRVTQPGMFEPIFTAAFGKMTSYVQYTALQAPAGATRLTNTASSAAYAMLGFGYELKLFSYARIGLLGGAQFQTALSTPGLDARPFEGPFLGGMFSLGKF